MDIRQRPANLVWASHHLNKKGVGLSSNWPLETPIDSLISLAKYCAEWLTFGNWLQQDQKGARAAKARLSSRGDIIRSNPGDGSLTYQADNWYHGSGGAISLTGLHASGDPPPPSARQLEASSRSRGSPTRFVS
jgi:hypothetical protein